ncbi:pentatricopeptide repeat-containing protein, partial [Quercus suber]
SHQNSTVSVNKRRHSKSYLERQSAILQLSSSSSQSHFDSALARLGGMLKVQDLNAVLRNFGTLSRRQDLSQIMEWHVKFALLQLFE